MLRGFVSYHRFILLGLAATILFLNFRVIRHIDVNSLNENQTDKLRIQIFQASNLKVLLGKKGKLEAILKSLRKALFFSIFVDLPLTLLPRKIINSNSENENSFVNSGNSLNSMFNANFRQNSQVNQSNAKSKIF